MSRNRYTLRVMTKPPFLKIPATTAMRRLSLILLCVPLILCSCSVQTYRFFVNKAQEGESIYIPVDTEHPGELLLYEAEGKTYLRGIRSRTTARSSAYIENHLPFADNRIREEHLPVAGAEQQSVYCGVQLQRASHNVRHWEKTDSPWLDSLPSNARPFRSSDHLSGFYSGSPVVGAVKSVETQPMRATGKALLYYPLAAGTFVAVDVPLTLAINAVLVCGGAVYITAVGCEEALFNDVVYSMGKRCIDAFTSEETSPSPSSGD